MNKTLVPLPWEGNISDFKNNTHIHQGYEWITTISTNKKIFLKLYQRWPMEDLPLNYECYIISFHLEAVDIAWLTRQSKLVNNIIVLCDGRFYNFTINNVTFLSYYYWQYQLNTMIKWFGTNVNKNIIKKASAICNRITESKLLTFTAVAEYIGTTNSMLVLNDWLEPDNIMKEYEIFSPSIQLLTDVFFKKYYKKIFKIDDFDNSTDNYQYITAIPWQPIYQNCAIHFTNESFHYSDISDKLGDYMHPGPFITEKTFKCLLGQTAFVPVGQFDTYGTLQKLGFEFNYNFDISFDSIIGDHDRLEAIINLIKQFANMSKEELFEGTRESSIYNYNHIVNGDFYDICEDINKKSIEKILNIIE